MEANDEPLKSSSPRWPSPVSLTSYMPRPPVTQQEYPVGELEPDSKPEAVGKVAPASNGRGEKTETGPSVSTSNNMDSEVTVESSPVEQVSLLKHVTSWWYLVVIIATPLVFLPIFLSVDDKHQRQARCGYVIAVMAVFWITEALPIAVTSLAPVVLLPAMGVMSAKDTSAAYFNDTSMLFIGGLLVAIAIEVWNVHKRIALMVLKIVGAEPKCLLFGIMLVTWFLSMWISNTATTAMMMTIVQALLQQFKDMDINEKSKKAITNGNLHSDPKSPDALKHKRDQERADAEFLRLSKALSLTAAYAANIGGIASLTGTGPNLVLFAAAQKVFGDVGLKSPVTFSTWLIYGLPLSLLVVLAMWAWMVVVFLRCKGGCLCCCCAPEANKKKLEKVNAMIRDEYNNLGPITYAQGTVLVTFVLLVVAWITRDLGGAGGWADWFPPGLSDSTPSILFGILMFVLPSSLPNIYSRRGGTNTYTKVTPLLKWSHVHEKMPWSLYLLLGGGYAIAQAATVSGLATWLGEQLMVFQSLNQWVVLLIISYIVCFATEVTSNTAIATLMMPILSQMSISLGVNPLFFMYPAAIATSFAFMLPVATPPNAIVFASGTVRVIDMVSSGLFLNIICVPILVFATATWGNAFFHFDQVPKEFLKNATSSGQILHS
ncbi:Na(+)/citrate cotransporter-like [Physella acuta]|uniref:Na(+)/citrate cotransporter-like n=1 Tax=Physella acuta TaxID=109671 RepID=UPI0027DC6720|nr:Na(+)/citrate cotransporter-like [Physella acuta]XP_059143662.1 Na(+)/citrate cotransporter-like [Physella acuta]XP_059143663.1 Na(+)/citrate cotransporter-like [Physella acuta]XP_059143664.1 Na(+)/citrate cotransporter-like [Physella acuta]XP_059143665.1 Na(+)/citrate cotransporter-like [Physella acuta]